MNKQITLTMPVKDLAGSQAFFSALGDTFDLVFSNDVIDAHGFEGLAGHTWQLNYMRGLPG